LDCIKTSIVWPVVPVSLFLSLSLSFRDLAAQQYAVHGHADPHAGIVLIEDRESGSVSFFLFGILRFP